VTLEAAPLTLNHLLESSGLSLSEVLVFRHRPYEPPLNRVIGWLAAERPDLFDCYQSTHASRTESALARAKYLVSFIRHRPGTALFVGLYAVREVRKITVEQALARPCHQELMSLGMSGYKATEMRHELLEFDMPGTGWHESWHGRLVIRWPGLERSWFRWADRNSFEVEAIAPESLLVRAMPEWDELTVAWDQLGVLPSSWRAALSQWRGIYLIIDESDGKQYVGSAYGTENILQRWMNYARTGHGGNKLLRERNPHDLRFAILQRVSPDMEDVEVIRIEVTWKDRLRSRAPYGLNEN
jgi:hypothetical protein